MNLLSMTKKQRGRIFEVCFWAILMAVAIPVAIHIVTVELPELEQERLGSVTIKEIAGTYRYHSGLSVCDLVNAPAIPIPLALDAIITPKHHHSRTLRMTIQKDWWDQYAEGWSIKYQKGNTPDVVAIISNPTIDTDTQQYIRTLKSAPNTDLSC